MLCALQAAQLLLTFLLQRHPPGADVDASGGAADSSGAHTLPGGAAEEKGGGLGGEASFGGWPERSSEDGMGVPPGLGGGGGGSGGGMGTPPPRRGSTPGLRVDVPASPGPTPGAGGPLSSSAVTPQGPLSTSSSAAGRRTPGAPWASGASPPAVSLLTPPRPRTSPVAAGILPGPGGLPGAAQQPPATPHIPGGTHAPLRAAPDVPAATAAAAAAAAEAAAAAQRQLWDAMAAAEERGTLLWSFLNGLALVPAVSLLCSGRGCAACKSSGRAARALVLELWYSSWKRKQSS